MKKYCTDKSDQIIALLHLITKKNIDVDFKNLNVTDDLINGYFENTKIPQIFSKEIDSISDEFFFDPNIYQLKFILNEIDEKYKSVRVAEFFFIALKKFKDIKVPRFDIIVSSFKAKKASLEIQNKRNSNISVSNEDENNVASDDQSKSSKKVSKPKTYKERIKKSKEHSKSEDPIEKIEYQLPEKFWNPPNPNCSTFNGILYDKSNYQHKQLRKEWLVHIKDIQQNIENDNDDKNPLQEAEEEKNNDYKYYKLFSYDEIIQRWNFNPNVFEQFAEDTGIKNNTKIHVPLILYYPSYDDNFTSNLLNFKQEYDSESEYEKYYFIYGVCTKFLSEINSIQDKKLIKPLFLFLNAPCSKKDNPQNKNIITQILTFLSSICDLEIMQINHVYNQWQLEMMKTMNNIIREFIKKKNEEKTETIDSKKKDAKSFVGNNYTDYYDKKKKDLYEEEEDKWDKRNDDDNNENEKLTIQYLNKIKFNENPKIIYLIDEYIVKNYNEKFDSNIKKNDFFQNFVSQIGKENRIHFIKFKKSNSYQNFLKSFTDFLQNCSTTYNDILNNFECLKLFNLSGAYIQIKTDLNSSKTELKNLIHQRFSMLQSNKKKYDNSYDLLFRLRDEIKEFFPLLMDSPISNEFEEIYSDLMKEIIGADRKIYEHELKKSSLSQLKYLNQSLDEKFYWTDEQLHIIKDSHISFVKHEFFEIIQIINFGKFLDIAYEDNFDILEKQIKKDCKKIDQMFTKFYQRIHTRNTAMEIDAKNGFQRSSNYSMKETENLREIKVAVEIGSDLKSVIEQDF